MIEKLHICATRIRTTHTEAQILRGLQEECAELIVACSHYLRPNRIEGRAEVLAEIADVALMARAFADACDLVDAEDNTARRANAAMDRIDAR